MSLTWLRMDIVAFIATLTFLLTSLFSEGTYSDQCPKNIRLWLVLSFINFYVMQVMIMAYFRTSSRRLSLVLWTITSFMLLPCMLLTNLWGNLLIEQMDNNPDCSYNGYA